MDILCVPVGPLQANCYLIWDDDRRGFAVDPGGEPERLWRLVQKETVSLEAVLVTHGHFDHIGGVKGLSEASGARVYCSSVVKPVLLGREPCSATGFPLPGIAEEAVHVVADGAVLNVGTLSVEVVGTPGHTPGDLTYSLDGHLFPGDLVFYRSVGRTDFPGGDFAELLASVARLAGRYPDTTQIHPGHMQATTLGSELAHNPFLGGLPHHG